MARCPAIKPSGERCKGEAIPGAEWCWSHNPARKEERRRNASKGGRSGGRGRGGEVAEIKSRLQELAEEVLSGAVATAPYAVANQLINTRLRAIELERKVKETEELEARIEELERTGGGGQRWGA